MEPKITFTGINYLAVVLAAGAGFFVGWPWYMAFGKIWARALGKDPDNPPKPAPKPFIVLAVAELIMAFAMAGLIGHMGGPTLRTGVITAVLAWAGFVVPVMAANHVFQGFSAKLTFVDAGHFLVVLIVMGAIIGLVGA